MSKKLWILLLAIAVIASWQWFFRIAPPAAAPKTIPVNADVAKKPATVAPAIQPKAAGKVTVTEKLSQPVAQSFALLATAYASELQYPVYSRPLTAADQHLLQPNAYLPQAVPLQGDAEATLVLPKYRFIYPEPVTVELHVNGLQVQQVQVALHSEQSGKQLVSEPMQQSQQHWHQLLAADTDWDGPLEVSVNFSANGKTQTLKTGIEYSQPVATITGVKDSYAAGADMVIPVQLDVEQAGHYRLRANLFTADGKPLAVLTGNEKLSEGSAQMELRAHKAVLRQHNGPFILRTFILEKRSASPGELSRYGDSRQPEYQLEYFGLDQLTDSQWQPDQEEQQRLQFLQQMAGQ